ncbi:hypothetical protein P4O66_016738 [Electrophorus voltai]|uniref:F-box protein 40, tandem duplicate 1 n=1 Tax=Electrophorus voltai TaxID=2609070 RepID=A0AAD8YWJ2_9TELE|nr:hypothetical protein P4O66_016738 [Electrophorus voltai]
MFMFGDKSGSQSSKSLNLSPPPNTLPANLSSFHLLQTRCLRLGVWKGTQAPGVKDSRTETPMNCQGDAALCPENGCVNRSRYRRTAPRLHRHCESCYSRHCRAPPEVSVSCMLINCRLLCGASFHMCKESEHTLLCPNEKVPCLNSCYGCPFTMSRSRLAKHLEVCPASVVCCSVEWNRWPTEDIKSPLYINLMKETHGQQSLDLSMALRDQKHLCGRLKMRSLFPELMEEPEVPIPSETDEAVGWEVNVNGESADSMGDETFINSPLIAAKEEHVEKGSQNLIVNKEKYDLFEKMFSMERGGCLQVQKASSKTGEKKDKNTQSKGSKNPAVSEQEGSSMEPVKVGQRGDTIQPDISKTGLAPWQEGVLERLSQEIEACTPREKDFVYGSLEPIPVQTLRSFNVPTSYKHKRIQLKDPSNQALTKHKSVDTSDLGVPEEDMQKMDEMFATLLCSAELEIRGHKISEKVATDGLYIDIATQTYNFSMAPFKYNSTLADITTERDLMLYLQMDTEIVTLRHNKNTSAFTQRRLQPSTHRATVSYNQDLSIFTLSPEITTSLLNDSQMVPTQNSTLSLVSRLFREVSATLLQERGMVGLKWRKKFYSHGRARWKSSIRRQRTPSCRLHRHCESCYSRRCRAPPEVSVSCMIINCRLLCGASFHMCKESEHTLLCPNEKVPCLNSCYGCPFTMSRSRLAKHLEVCPSSVVCCSMEWNRWPIEETEPPKFYQNILKENYTQEPLDLSMAIRDQNHLFHSLRMKVLFPELIEKVEEKLVTQEMEGAIGGMLDGVQEICTSTSDIQEGGLTQEAREALARDTNITGLAKYDVWEKMFSMELSGCKHTVKALGKNLNSSSGNPSTDLQPQTNPSKLEVFKEELLKQPEELFIPNDIPKFNPYEMDEDKFLIAKSLFACDTRPNKKFVYGYLEPMKIKTVRTFKVPTSFMARPGHIRNPMHYKRVSKAVDTSDIERNEMPKWDEVQATLLCSLEKELRGHLIAESSSTDALFVDKGTQTYDFYTAPFKANATLADITADSTFKLHVQIQTESVTNRHNKSSSAFTYLCGHSFRRDEFPYHFKNVHSDIQTCLNGWFEERCPLAYLGCTFSQRRLRPSKHRAMISYNKDLSTLTLRPEVSSILFEGVRTVSSERKWVPNMDALSKLPFEVLVHIAGFLDSFTLSQLALVSRLMREVCSTLLQEKGMVSLKWEKKIFSHGRWCWRSRQKVWQFSNLFSPVEN